MKKRFLSLVCVVSLLVNINIGNFKTYATDKTTFSINEDNVFFENGIKTKYIKNEDIFKILADNGIDYKTVFSKKQILEMKEEDKKLDKKIEDINSKPQLRYKRFSDTYTRLYIPAGFLIGLEVSVFSSTVIAAVAVKMGISLSTAELLIASASEIISSNFDGVCYAHWLSTSYSGIDTMIVKFKSFQGWVHHDIQKCIDNSYPKSFETLATKWYYIEEERICGAQGDEWKIIDNKWYKFNEYGILIEYEGWEVINDRWMYFVPGNFGAYRDGIYDINGEIFTFNEDGYCTCGRGCE